MSEKMDKVVVLARGLGTRMRKTDHKAQLTAEQAAIAETGVKALIPIERPFLDYVLTAVADAGYRRICLVVGPEHDELRSYYSKLPYRRLAVEFATQQKPVGTADAVVSAKAFAGNDPFLVINSDNYYPVHSLEAMRDLDGPGLPAFEKESMLAGSNIPADRIVKFAVLYMDGDGYMRRIIEKPDAATLASLKPPILISMNCFRFDPTIFEACRHIKPSPRGELELPDAVQYAIEHMGVKYRVVGIHAPVLDLSSRADVEGVAARLRGMEIRL